MAKKTKQQRHDNLMLLLQKILLIVLSTLSIVYFLPRTTGFTYTYNQDEPWEYGELIAPFEYPVSKRPEVLRHELDSAMRYYEPYYELSSMTGEGMLTRFRHNAARVRTDETGALYTRHITKLIDSVYSRGIFSADEYASIISKHYPAVHLLNGNSSVTVPTSRILSTKTAYELIMNADTVHFSRLIMQEYNIYDYVVANTSLDSDKSEAARQELHDMVYVAIAKVMPGEKIVDHGEIVTEDVFLKLESLKAEHMRRHGPDDTWSYKLWEHLWFVSILMLILITYMTLFRKDYFYKLRSAILPFVLVVTFSITASLLLRIDHDYAFLLPFCMVPIIIRVFMDSRTAFMFHCCLILIVSQLLTDKESFIFTELVGGMIAIQTLRELSERSQIIRSAGVITLSQFAIYFMRNLEHYTNLASIFDTKAVYILLSGVLLIFSYPLLYFFEKIFGFVSDVTLVELSNTSHPLLQEMSEKAPGTFQHSIQVSNLASYVAKKIGAKAQLVRTGALYHDIGKVRRAAFFTENQAGINPHKRLNAKKSAEVIIAHVTNGLQLADEYNLPDVIKRFVATHHGCGKAKYFYITYRNEHPDEEIDESIFSYPGPNPASKEEAILMMADAVEAASRSLPEYTEESINNLVENIVNSQVADGFFAECAITFRDIAMAKAVFKEKLMAIYHTRVTYPELNEK